MSMRRGSKQALAQHSTLELTTHSAAETQESGERLGRLLQPGHVVALIGELGTGKTCLTQGIARGLGVEGPVTSPTFIMVNEYRTAGGAVLYHIDCYRFQEQGMSEALAIGVDELLGGDGICVVEWAERIEPLLPPDRLTVTLLYVNHTARRLCFEASGERHTALLNSLKVQSLRGSAFGVVSPESKP
ncbi:MAG: tRNA (adenosine(37)-N6)-threonylcarbamoyltransferase complex ATPase subunit type 1 TsaE [Anaerolineae bacterium]|nr:tRNA (adenosine(37)-N6)-threonylcarbamoyltransferase complex ATPase subunit type 1 TsaE [Anaerolineae bacterium]